MNCLNYNYIWVIPNFQEDHLQELRRLWNSFILENNIDLRLSEIYYVFQSDDYLRAHGTKLELKESEFLKSLGRTNINFNSNFSLNKCVYQETLNYIIQHRGIVVFLGNPIGIGEEIHQALNEGRCVSYIELYQDIKTRYIWVGEPDNY